MAIVLDTVNNPEDGGDEMLQVFKDFVDLAKNAGWKFWNDLSWKKPEAAGKIAFGLFAISSAPGFARDHEWILLFFKDQKKLGGDHALCDLTRDEHLAWRPTTCEIRAETRKEILATPHAISGTPRGTAGQTADVSSGLGDRPV